MTKPTQRRAISTAKISALVFVVGLLTLTTAGPLAQPTLGAQGRSTQAPGRANLEELHQRLLPVFELAGVVFTDADERSGRLVVGVLNGEVEGLIRGRLTALGVPSESVDVVASEPIFNAVSLRDYNRPVIGGVQIRFSNYLCSLGFNAVRDGIAGFVTASHCSTKQGTVDGTAYYQPLNALSTEFIGTEIADPAYRKMPGCPRGRVCRYSDANFVDGADGASLFALGQIAKTTSVNTGSLDVAGSFTVVGTAAASVGQTAHKVGRTTGWTQGTVTNTCVNTSVSGSTILLLCQNFVQGSDAQIANSGDSGSPVFAITSGDSVELLGNLWGTNSSNTLFVYSPLANIVQELGALITY